MSTRSPENDAQLVERIRRHLDDEVAALDGATLSRLRQARQRALSAATAARLPRWPSRWLAARPVGDWLLPAGAFASVIATVLALTLMVTEPVNGPGRDVDDLELLTAGEELELYENLEFYLWLEDREQTG